MNRINLLPQEERAKASRERGLIYAILILVGVVVVLGLVYMKYDSSVKAKQQELSDVEARAQVMQQRATELQPYSAIQSQRTAMTETAKGIYAAGVPFSILLQEISLIIPDKVRLVKVTATVPSTMLPGAAAAPQAGAAATTATAAARDIIIEGKTLEHRYVAEFMTRLGLMPQIKDIVLETTKMETSPILTPKTSSGAANATSTTPVEATPSASPSPSEEPFISFTITVALRPYVQAPPATALEAGAAQ